MDDFLSRMADRALERAPVVRPLVGSSFESSRAPGGGWEPDSDDEAAQAPFRATPPLITAEPEELTVPRHSPGVAGPDLRSAPTRSTLDTVTEPVVVPPERQRHGPRVERRSEPAAVEPAEHGRVRSAEASVPAEASGAAHANQGELKGRRRLATSLGARVRRGGSPAAPEALDGPAVADLESPAPVESGSSAIAAERRRGPISDAGKEPQVVPVGAVDTGGDANAHPGDASMAAKASRNARLATRLRTRARLPATREALDGFSAATPEAPHVVAPSPAPAPVAVASPRPAALSAEPSLLEHETELALPVPRPDRPRRGDLRDDVEKTTRSDRPRRGDLHDHVEETRRDAAGVERTAPGQRSRSRGRTTAPAVDDRTVRIEIGRVEVRAEHPAPAAPAAPAAPVPAPLEPRLSLDDYLRTRGLSR